MSTETDLAQRRARQSRLRYGIGVLLLAALPTFVGACAAPGGGGTSTPPGGQATHTPDPSRLDGCLLAQMPADAAAFHADVVVTQSGQNPQQVSLTVGERLQVRLISTFRWQLRESDPNASLAPTSAEGWFETGSSAGAGACVWDFTAAHAGSVTLDYAGGAVCLPDVACPAIAAVATFDVTVRG